MNNKRFEIGASEQPLDIIKETCGFAGVFKQIGVIGDSLASGEFESHDENGNIVYTDMYEYSWPAVLERITGTKYNNYSRGGMTAREYVQSWADANGFWQWNQAYIIALGNNDSFVFGHPLGSPVPPAKNTTIPFSKYLFARSLENSFVKEPHSNGVKMLVIMPTERKISET